MTIETLPDGFDPKVIEKWDPKTQAKVAAVLGKALGSDPKAWYCTRGRKCDGKPHAGYDYPHARGDQWPPVGDEWFVWLMISGRGAGKTRTGSEWMRKMSEKVPRMAMIARRGPDIRGTMVEGESGLIAVCERAGMDYTWEPSKKEFTFGNGAKAFGYSAEEPDTLRGPQHGAGWLDEPAHMPLIEEVWAQLMFGMRVMGTVEPKVLCTSTPLPTKWLKNLMNEPDTVVVRTSTYVNIDNLAATFRKQVLSKFEGTRLGRQEIHGEVLEDVEGALWQWDLIENHRDESVDPMELARSMDRIVVGVDPAGTATRKSDETGIVVVGVRGRDFYVFADRSGKYSPERWARTAMDMHDFYEADAVVVEKNYGGDMVKATLSNIDSFPSIKMVGSRRGKALRAEPVVALYEQGRVHHVGIFEELETQMTEWVPEEKKDSPDRVDALVHAITNLAKIGQDAQFAAPPHTPVRRTGTGTRAAMAPHLQVVGRRGLRSVS